MAAAAGVRESSEQAPGRGQARRPADRLAALHAALTNTEDPHDTLLELTEVGNESSVPFLIDALLRDESASVPYPDHTRTHLLATLQVITNQDAGSTAVAWQAWYESHKQWSQPGWILEGFADRQFPVSSPPDDRFIAALVRACDPQYRPDYIRTNAGRLLDRVPADAIAGQVRALAASTSPSDRRGAVAVLERRQIRGAVEILRRLRVDPEIDVAEAALRVLNNEIRTANSSSSRAGAGKPVFSAPAFRLMRPLDDRSVLVSVDRSVVAVDVRSRRTLWTYRTADRASSGAAVVGDRVYFVSEDRILHCVTIQGTPVWTRGLAGPRSVQAPPVYAAGSNVLIPDATHLYLVSAAGDVETTVFDRPLVSRFAADEQHIFGAVQGGALLVFDRNGRLERTIDTGIRTAALSLAGTVLCVVGSGAGHPLQCLDAHSLQRMWNTSLEDDAPYRLVQDSQYVYALGHDRTIAFDIATGHRAWALRESGSTDLLFTPVGSFVLRLNPRYQLEWLDASSGEFLVAAEPTPVMTHDAVVVDDGVLIDEQPLTSSKQARSLTELRVVFVPRPGKAR